MELWPFTFEQVVKNATLVINHPKNFFIGEREKTWFPPVHHREVTFHWLSRWWITIWKYLVVYLFGSQAPFVVTPSLPDFRGGGGCTQAILDPVLSWRTIEQENSSKNKQVGFFLIKA